MRVDHGTYTMAHEIGSGDTWDAASKIYTNDVNDEDVTFTLTDGSQVVVHVYRGTIIPLVTTGATWSNGGSMVILN